MLCTFIVYLVYLLLILLRVAFFTLFERKFMGLVHIRVGPNKVAFFGVIQPLLDAVKLLSKVPLYLQHVNLFSYNLSPHFSLVLSLCLWLVPPIFYSFVGGVYSMLVFMMVGSIMVFFVLLGGWSSNSKYSLIGSLRSVAQSISYEAVFTTLVIVFIILSSGYRILVLSKIASFLIFFLLPIWIFTTLAETHRAPFDFSESESELVSGFNTEYSGVYFAYLFLSEYGVLLVSRIVISHIFFSPKRVTGLVILVMLVLSLFIVIRVTFCRYRYDYLMIAA